MTFFSDLLFQACTTIFLEYGSYGNEDCLDAIDLLQKYLLTSLPLSLFEHLSEDRNSCNRNSYPGANQLLIWSKDPRIKLGVFLHPALTKFRLTSSFYFCIERERGRGIGAEAVEGFTFYGVFVDKVCKNNVFLFSVAKCLQFDFIHFEFKSVLYQSQNLNGGE